MSHGSRRRVAIAIIACFLLLPAAAWADCPGAETQANEISVSDYATALLCEVNAVRAQWGRSPLALQGNLVHAGNAFAAQMVAEQFFAHVAPDGTTPADRFASAGFIPRSGHWRVGGAENLAAGRGPQGTPAAIVAGWMQSDEHRANLLDRSFTKVGVGVARGWPQPDDTGNAMTVALELGYRAKAPSMRRLGRHWVVLYV